MFTYEVAPVYNLIEMVTLDKMRKIIGWEEPCDGLFNPGLNFFILIFYLNQFLKM